jgi:hypothetical protein
MAAKHQHTTKRSAKVNPSELPRMARDAFIDSRDIERHFAIALAERLLALPTQALIGISAASTAAAIYFAWLGFLPQLWLSSQDAAAAFLPSLVVACASTAMCLYRRAFRDPYDAWPIARNDLNIEIDLARRDPGSPHGHLKRLHNLKLQYLELVLKRQFDRRVGSVGPPRMNRRATDGRPSATAGNNA